MTPCAPRVKSTRRRRRWRRQPPRAPAARLMPARPRRRRRLEGWSCASGSSRPAGSLHCRRPWSQVGKATAMVVSASSAARRTCMKRRGRGGAGIRQPAPRPEASRTAGQPVQPGPVGAGDGGGGGREGSWVLVQLVTVVATARPEPEQVACRQAADRGPDSQTRKSTHRRRRIDNLAALALATESG